MAERLSCPASGLPHLVLERVGRAMTRSLVILTEEATARPRDSGAGACPVVKSGPQDSEPEESPDDEGDDGGKNATVLGLFRRREDHVDCWEHESGRPTLLEVVDSISSSPGARLASKSAAPLIPVTTCLMCLRTVANTLPLEHGCPPVFEVNPALSNAPRPPPVYVS
ncbi:hypothetical protein HPB47_017009 [Ixodes persulcatus]|uniref:Uncharacterized protein n=1 Tax=Ixodes persulcatus TaxID=34615 RepID=A0AC60QS07_IXOPE|nr:hypothetical protein HPB47_017009 [Ixodes persulcatus]